MVIDRVLDIQLPKGQSAFLWGARKTGKSTYLKQRFPDSIYYDFLKTDLVLEFVKRPALLREQLLARNGEELARPVILDEVQKVPAILDEVHWLIENENLSFILCGSSARKLKRGQANLLGGRAWRFEMYPLVSKEVEGFELLHVLNHGMLPAHYLSENPRRSLNAYVVDYLKEEVFDEGLTRNIPAFSRFFEALGFSHGELTNYSDIARDCGVDSKTVKEYYQILVDTLIGSYVLPFKRRQNRQVITKKPKFYLFDIGVANALSRRRVEEERGESFGRALEHFIFTELKAHASYKELDYEIRFWRTKSGTEVDFILGDGEVAVEVKGSRGITGKQLRSLAAFRDEYFPSKVLLVCNESEERVAGDIRIVPWRKFLQQLWAGDIIR